MGMLVLGFGAEDFAFVYCGGRPIGAIRNGCASASKVKLLFSGDKRDFEVLRPAVVSSRFGNDELERLVKKFLCPALAGRY